MFLGLAAETLDRRWQVAKGAFAAIESVAAENKGQVALGSSSTETGVGVKNCKTIVSARDLLSLPCVNTRPIDVLRCYERCKSSRAAEATAAAPLLQVEPNSRV